MRLKNVRLNVRLTSTGCIYRGKMPINDLDRLCGGRIASVIRVVLCFLTMRGTCQPCCGYIDMFSG